MANDLSRHTGHCGVWRNIMQHHATCTHLCTSTNLNVAEDCRASTDQDTSLHFGVTIPSFFSRAAKGDAL